MSKQFCDDTRNNYLASCLYDCIEDSNIRAIKQLLNDKDANPNIIIPDKGITPFHLAIGNGKEPTAVEITKLFLNHGGNPNIRSEEKLTPVHIAAAWGRLKILNILLNSGGDPTLIDEEGKSALDYAKQEQHCNIVEYLENYLNDLIHNTKNDKIFYDIELDKVIINSGAIVAEYGILRPNNTESILDALPKDILNSYVNNWCKIHSNKTADNLCNKNDSSEDSFNKSLNYSRESGILTIPSSDTSAENYSSIDILNKCINSITIESNNTSEYLSCCETKNTLDKNICSSLLTLDLSDNEIRKSENLMTSDQSIEKIDLTDEIDDHVTNIPCQFSIDNETDTNVSITEEYKYVDKDEGIILIEKRILVNPKIDDNNSILSAASSTVSSLPSILDYDTDTLRLELTQRGEPPGPITKTTKRVYLKKLKKLKKTFINYDTINLNQKVISRVYSVELEKTLRNATWNDDLTIYKSLENIVVTQFTNPEPTKRWREGLTKASFTYLLLDPRITKNLPGRADKLNQDESWKTFLQAIFYVGKGKRSRPYSHLYEAVTYWKKGAVLNTPNKKIEYILDIWKDQFGVICLHIFQNVIPVEAYTREAAMINALRLANLCNAKSGDFYGVSATWPERQKRLLGVYLLYRAMLIFFNEGERQLRPDDIGK